MIGWYTKAPFNHVSIAFDEHLNKMYSFGRKSVLKQGGIELLAKPDKLTTPSDFECNEGLELVYHGYLGLYHDTLQVQKLSS